MKLRTKLLASSLALIASVTLLATLLVPAYIARKIAAVDAADARFTLHGVRVSPRLHVRVARVDLHTSLVEGACEDLHLRPALLRSLSTPTLDSVTIARCETRQPNDAPTLSDHELRAPDAVANVQTMVEGALDALARELRRFGERVDSLAIEAISHEHKLLDNHIYIHFNKLEYETPFFADPKLRFHLATSGLIEIPDMDVALRAHGDSISIHATPLGPMRVGERGVSFAWARLESSERAELDTLVLESPHPAVERVSLQSARLVLDEAWYVELEGGEVHLFDDGGASRSDSRTDDDEDARRARRRRLLNEETPPPPEDLFSMRVLTRARTIVRSLDDAWVDIERRLESLPLELHVLDVSLHRGGRAVAAVEDMLLSPSGAIEGDLRVGQASLSLTSDPARRRHWSLIANDARLSRLAAIIDLQDHVEGTLNAEISVSLVDGVLAIEGPFSVENARLEHAAVSPRPIEGVDLSGELGLSLPAYRDSPVVASLDAEVNGIPTVGRLTLTPELDRARIQGSFGLARPLACQEVWAAIPEGLVPDLGKPGVRFTGEAQPMLSLNYLPGHFSSFQLSAEGFPGTCTVNIIATRYNPHRLLSERYVHDVVEGVSVDDIRVGPGTRDYVRVSELPTYIPAVMYLSEEINFPQNPGISIGLINKAIRYSLPRERYAYGGSTVTQQLVKNLFFTRDKHLARKFQEAIVVWAVESTLTKERIIELYMNCIEFGPDLYGIVRAARFYFSKEAQELTPLESAWLASLKPSPGRGRRDWQRGYSDYNNWNSARIRELFFRLHKFGEFLPLEAMDDNWPWVVTFPTSPNAGATPPGFDESQRPTRLHAPALEAQDATPALGGDDSEEPLIEEAL